MIKLLHIEKYIPDSVLKTVAWLQGRIDVTKMSLSRHIQEHLEGGDHKHGYNKESLLKCVQSLKDNPVDPFEVEVEVRPNNKHFITKFVVRIPYDRDRDISVSIRGNKIITAWLNHVDDIHHTLDLSKYSDSL
jgi:hypothetical protein